MDPIAVLASRIELLEAKLGINPYGHGQQDSHEQGDSATENLLNAAQAISNATAGQEKLTEAMPIATELNNYSDPNHLDNMQQGNIRMQEVTVAEPILKRHCQCMHKCKQVAPVMDSEALQNVPEMQATVDRMHEAAAEVKAEVDEVSHGVQELAETCGTAAANASEQLVNIAQKVDNIEQKMFPKRRNGLD